MPPRALRRLIAPAADANAARAAGVVVDGADDAPGALGAAPLVALVRWLLDGGEPDALALVCAGDDGGAGSAAVVVAS